MSSKLFQRCHPVFRKFIRAWLIELLLERDGDTCGYCGKRLILNPLLAHKDSRGYTSIDHIHSSSKGGSDDIDNLRLCHQGCNNERGSLGDLKLHREKRPSQPTGKRGRRRQRRRKR